MRTGRPGARDVPLAYARARANPFVVGVHQLFQVGVGQHFRRDVASYAGNLRRNPMGHKSPRRFLGPTRVKEFYAMPSENAAPSPFPVALVTAANPLAKSRTARSA